MAIFKLGAIVTDIVGSIGGTTFKRGSGNPVMLSKSNGGSRNKLLQNKQLNKIANIFKQWSQLTTTLRDDWNAAALLYEFPDKFGVLRNLSGRQLFTKMNIQLLPVNASITDPAGISSLLPVFSIDNSEINILVPSAHVVLTSDAEIGNYMFSLEISYAPLESPVFSAREVLLVLPVEFSVDANLWDALVAKFPYYGAGYNVRVYVQVVNDSGFKSVAQTAIFSYI